MRKLLLLLMLPLSVLFASCSQDDDNITQSDVIDEVSKQFKKDYPSATDVKWNMVEDYAVALFNLDAQAKSSATTYSHKAWYKNHKEHAHRKYMWERDIDYRDLPVAVKAAFESSIYANWEIDDVEEINRYNMDPIYSIEVEGEDAYGNDIEVDLYYDNTGVLIKEKIDSDDDDFDKNYGLIVDKDLPDYIKDFLSKNHANSRVVDVDVEDDDLDEIEGDEEIKHWEIEIVEDRIKKEVIFNYSPVSWIYTKWEVERELPGFILEAVYKNYPEYELDDEDEYGVIVHNVEGLLYKVELEYDGDHDKEDLYVYFNEKGEVVAEVEND